MIAAILTLLPILSPTPQGPLPPDSATERTLDSYETLLDEFKRASLEWRRARRTARRDKEKADTFDTPHPIGAFFPRFQELASAGDGQAVLWVGLNVEETERTPGEVRTIKRAAFERVVSEFIGEEFVGELVKRASRQTDHLTDEEICALLRRVVDGKATDEVRTAATYTLAERLRKRETGDAVAAAEQLYNRVIADAPESKFAGKAKKKIAGMRFTPGKIAPDFESEDVEGNSFKLSDYRGKVVVLDFWGFW